MAFSFSKNRESAIYFVVVDHCLDRRELSSTTLKAWSELSPDLIFAAWIEELTQKEQSYLSLFSEAERKKLYEEHKKLQFTPQLILRGGTITTLYTQLHLLQQLHKKPPTDQVELLKHLITLRQEGMTSHLGERLYKAYARGDKELYPHQRLKIARERREETSFTTPQALQASVGKVPTLEEIEKKQLFSLEKLQEEFLSFSLLSQEGVSVQGQKGQEALHVDFSI